jgi:hypothetical protein
MATHLNHYGAWSEKSEIAEAVEKARRRVHGASQ